MKQRWNALNLLGALLCLTLLANCGRTEPRPNIVFVLIDDLGYMDCGFNGSTFYETPHLDRLREDSMRFTDAYSTGPVCSPTRASIMTGRYPPRVGITDYIPGEGRSQELLAVPVQRQLDLGEVTVAEAFAQAGYRTAFIGKWHLGGSGYYPTDQGFEINVAGNRRGHPTHGYFSPYNLDNLSNGPDGEYLPDRLATEAIRFIEDNVSQPFFLFLSHYTVHSPVQAKPDRVAYYRSKLESLTSQNKPLFEDEFNARNRTLRNDPTFAAQVASMDENVGRVLNRLRELKLEEKTIVIFTSDNGGQSILENFLNQDPWGSNRPLRAGKGWHYEGGIRVPLLVKWPGVTRPGSNCTEPAISTDFYPTLLNIAGLPAAPEQHLDGFSLVPLLRNDSARLSRSALFWHYPHYHASGHRPSGAVRSGRYKLIEFFEDMRVELYDLRTDLREEIDLSRSMPEKVTELTELLHTWRQEVGAVMPQENPGWTPPSQP